LQCCDAKKIIWAAFLMITMLLNATIANSDLAAFFQVLTWLKGRLLVFIIQRRMTNNTWLHQWHDHLRALGVTAAKYTKQFFDHEHVVYAKIACNRHHFYIGLTNVSIANRERSRLRKLKQLRRGLLVQCEPALRWWNKCHCYNQFTCIIIALCDNPTHALVTEATLISKFQPGLNAPAIYKFFSDTAIGSKAVYTMPKTKYHTTHKNGGTKTAKHLCHLARSVPHRHCRHTPRTPGRPCTTWGLFPSTASTQPRNFTRRGHSHRSSTLFTDKADVWSNRTRPKHRRR